MAKGILHIGLPKTGTTSFQNAVFLNRKSIYSDFGIYYPDLASNLTDVLCTAFHDDPRKHVMVQIAGVDTREKAEELRRSTVASLTEDIEKQPWETLVLSAEGLANFYGHEYEALAEWALRYTRDWTVLFWPRHPVRFAISNAQEMIKGGYTFQRLTAESIIPYFRERIGNAAVAFGLKNIEIVPFEIAQASNGGVVAEFCRKIGVPDLRALEIASTADRLNISLSRLATY